jgi:hypothetical protein
VDTLVQQHIDDSFRGRVFSLYDVLFNVSFVAAAGAGVVLLPMTGKSHLAVVLIAAGYLGAGVGYRASLSKLRRPGATSTAAEPSAVEQAQHAARTG